jgi:hypothetical protein
MASSLGVRLRSANRWSSFGCVHGGMVIVASRGPAGLNGNGAAGDGGAGLKHSDLEIGVCFEFRISNFESDGWCSS